MRKLLKPTLAVISGVITFFAVMYLFVMVDRQLAFLAVVGIPLLTGLAFKAGDESNWLKYPLCISLPPVAGFGFVEYMSAINFGFLAMPFVVVSAMMGTYLRNKSDNIFQKKYLMGGLGYTLICTLVLVSVVPEMQLFDNMAQQVDEPLPSVELMTLDEKTKMISKMEEDIVVVDFWATWCGPCLQLMPKLEQLNRKYDDDPRVTVMAVNTSWKNSMEDVRGFLDKNPKDVNVLYDKDARLTEKLGIRGIPRTVIIDNREGRLRMKLQGFTPSMDYVGTVTEHVERLLKEKGT